MALSVLRNQVVSPLEHAGVRVHWDLLALLDQTIIDRQHALNAFRILQEAIHNAFHRAQCTELVVSAEYSPQAPRLVISVTNAGGLALRPDAPEGHGIRNMRRRATMIGARLRLMPRSTGARLDLCFGPD